MDWFKFLGSSDVKITDEVNESKDTEGKHINEYIVHKTLGSGAYSKVKEVSKGEEKFAVK